MLQTTESRIEMLGEIRTLAFSDWTSEVMDKGRYAFGPLSILLACPVSSARKAAWSTRQAIIWQQPDAAGLKVVRNKPKSCQALIGAAGP